MKLVLVFTQISFCYTFQLKGEMLSKIVQHLIYLYKFLSLGNNGTNLHNLFAKKLVHIMVNCCGYFFVICIHEGTKTQNFFTALFQLLIPISVFKVTKTFTFGCNFNVTFCGGTEQQILFPFIQVWLYTTTVQP